VASLKYIINLIVNNYGGDVAAVKCRFVFCDIDADIRRTIARFVAFSRISYVGTNGICKSRLRPSTVNEPRTTMMKWHAQQRIIRPVDFLVRPSSFSSARFSLLRICKRAFPCVTWPRVLFIRERGPR